LPIDAAICSIFEQQRPFVSTLIRVRVGGPRQGAAGMAHA
jgi:hypothetical protein